MKFSSGGTVLITKNYFGTTESSYLCREYVVSSSETLACYKVAFIIVICSCLIHRGIFLKQDEASNYSTYFLFSMLCFSLFMCLYSTVENESLLLVVPLTLQMTTTYILGNQSTFSMPWSAIGDFMIMEVIMGQKVHYFLSLVINSDISCEDPDHIILFRNIKPPLICLEVVYRDLQKILDRSR